jgi:hypothetical protein
LKSGGMFHDQADVSSVDLDDPDESDKLNVSAHVK